MSALPKLALAASGALPGRILPTLTGRDSISRPVLSLHSTTNHRQYAEKPMGKAKLKVVVNSTIYTALQDRAEDHGQRRKVVARELGVSENTVKKLRAGTQGVSLETIQAICRRDPTIRALVIQSLGPVAELDPQAVNKILRGGK